MKNKIFVWVGAITAAVLGVLLYSVLAAETVVRQSITPGYTNWFDQDIWAPNLGAHNADIVSNVFVKNVYVTNAGGFWVGTNSAWFDNEGTTAANTRGRYSTDLQRLRSAGTQIPGTDFASTYGANNTASAYHSWAQGSNNVAGGIFSRAYGIGNTIGAAGSHSVISGTSCGTSNQYVTIYGSGSCNAPSDYTSMFGCVSSTATTAGAMFNSSSSTLGTYGAGGFIALGASSSIGSGGSLTASGAIFGPNSTITDGSGCFASGSGNTVSGSYSHALGFGNSTTKRSSIAIGEAVSVTGTNAVGIGFNVEATETDTIALGYFPKAEIPGQIAFSSGRVVAGGDGQYSFLPLYGKMTNSVTTTMYLTTLAGPGITQSRGAPIVPVNTLWHLDVTVLGRTADNGTSAETNACYRFVDGLIKRDNTAGSISIVVAPTKTVLHEDNTDWDCAVTVDASDGSVHVDVTGDTDNTLIYWFGLIRVSQVKG